MEPSRKLDPMRQWRAIVFDLDGTLTDSAPAMTRALNAVWRDLGRPETDATAVKGYIGDGPRLLIERARRTLGLDAEAGAAARETAAFLDAYAAEGPGGALYPGVLETLTCLRASGFHLAVCTNKPQGPADRMLAALGLAPLLAGAVGGDAAPRRKPDPAHVLAALARIGDIAPADAVLVGDGPQDVAAAEAAGLGVIVAAYGYGGAADLRPDLPKIDGIEALPALLGAVPGRSPGKTGTKTPR